MKPALTVKGEQVKEVIQSRAVKRHVGAQERQRNGVGEVVAAAVRHSVQMPVSLDELQDGYVIRIIMRDVSGFGVGRNDDERDARTVAEEVHRLDVTGIVVASAFVEGDHDGGILPKSGIGLNRVDDLLRKAFEQIEL